MGEIGRIGITGDNRRLYLEAGGRVERWLSLPTDGALSNPPTAFMLGDSILDGGQNDIVARLSDWNVTVDAVIGRSSAGGITPAESLPAVPHVVALELSGNATIAKNSAANAQPILDAIDSHH